MMEFFGKHQSYEQWLASAERRDRRRATQRWIQEDASPFYDHLVIRRRYEELCEARRSEDVQRLLHYMQEGFHGNMAGMGNPRLYQQTRQGRTKHLITDYIAEMVAALDQIASTPDAEIPHHEKLQFFRRSAHCFGRSALMLSGAGVLGPFHAGVLKALCEHQLLPTVISGSSAGAIMAAMLATRRDLRDGKGWDSAIDLLMQHWITWNSPMFRQEDLWDCIEALIPDMTFEEALEESGIHLCVSVAPAKVNQRARLLNPFQSASACIREGVLASCSIPGIYPAVTLAAKTATGERKPYVGSRTWIDGSVTDDLPAHRLSRLYAANHFICSQANPLVPWAWGDPNGQSLGNQLLNVWQTSVREWARVTYPFVMDRVRNIYPLNLAARMGFGIMTQQYSADVNIMPEAESITPNQLLRPLTEASNRDLVAAGERATWPKLEVIRNCTAVSRCIDRTMLDLERHAGAPQTA